MKLLNIVANNFKICEKKFTISFIPKANKTEEDKEFELHEIDDNLFVFKTLGFIGKNASGKTSSMELLALVYDIFSTFRVKTSTYLFKYWDKTINLDITFYHDGYLYRYITDLLKDSNAVNDNTIIFRNQKLYKRVYMKTYAKKIFDYDKYMEVKLDNNLPEDTSIIYYVLKNITYRGIYCPSNDYVYANYSSSFNIYKLLDENEKIIEAILKMFDEHLSKIEMVTENKFKIYYSNKEIKEVTNTELYSMLSSGTTKGFGLFNFVVYSLKTGCDLIIDEVENHFHKTLVENLVSLYKDKSVNKNNATLIFTTHYCEVLDLFNRTDNIYITKYDKSIYLENMHEDYNFRPELSKSKKFYSNTFGTDVSYEALMNFKKELM